MDETSASAWPTEKLGNLATWLSGGTPRTTEASYWGGDIPWITSGSLTDFYLYDSDRRVTALGVENGSRVVPEGSILFVVRGMSLKSEFRIGIAKRRLAFGQDCKALLPNSGVDPLFLAQAIRARSSEVLAMVDEAGHGTGRLATDRIKSLRIPIPPLPEQHAIAEVIGALDDKIETNRRLVSRCDALWQTSAGAVLDAIEEGGPKSGSMQPLSSIAKFINGRAFTKNAAGSGRMVLRIAELHGGPGPSTIYNDIDVPGDHLASPGDLLFAWSGSLTVQRWFRSEAIVNQHIFKVIPEPEMPIWCVHAHLLRLLPGFQRIAAGKATTMGHIQRRELDTEIGVPSGETLRRLDVVCGALWRRALQAEIETLAISRLRDAILPPLTTGELRVSLGNADTKSLAASGS